jgi:hypothetical protein
LKLKEFRERPLSQVNYRQWLGWLRWLVPATLVLLVGAYAIALAPWIYGRYGFAQFILVEILLFGTVGPLIVFILLDFLVRWLDERDTTDLQAQMLAQARQEAQKCRELSDDALQILFTAGNLIATLKATHPDLPPDRKTQIEMAEKALKQAAERLRGQLLKK